MITPERLKEIEQLAEAATKGPWFSRESRRNPNLRVICTNNRSERLALTNGDELGRNNSRLIAASREIIHELIAEVRRLREVLDQRARDAIGEA